MDMGAHLYFFYDYIGNLLYYFEFSPTCMRANIVISAPFMAACLATSKLSFLGKLFHLMASTTGPYFGSRMLRVEKRRGWCHTPEGGS